MDFLSILNYFKNVKFVSENLYRADCPACSDTKQHLYISKKDSKILVDCKKGCSFSEIVKASNLKASDFFNDDTSNKKPRWNLLRTHNYTDEAGRTIAKKEIYDKGDGDKTAIWYRAEGKKFVKGLNGLKMPLYHLHKFINAPKSVPLYIVEGEKDVETMERLGLIATTSPNGAGSKWSKAHNKYLDGWNVVILADNDEAGRKHAEQTARTIAGTVKALKVIQSAEVYPDLKKKGDISDIVKEIGAEQAKARLIETQKKTPVFSPDSETAPFITAEQEQPETKFYMWDDTGNAEMFVNLYGENIRYNYVRKKWLVYDGKKWAFSFEDKEIGFFVDKTLKHMNDNILSAMEKANKQDEALHDTEGYKKHIKATRSNKGRNNMLDISRHHVGIEPKDLDENDLLFNCQNGTLDLETFEFKPHNRLDYITKISSVEYNPNAKSPLFEKFIADIMQNDAELIEYLQKVLGYCLTGLTREECFFIFYGLTTRNGKSTLLETFSYLLGDTDGYSVSVAPSTLIERNSGGASPEILHIKGARLMRCGELKAEAMLDDTFIKSITGNDMITARALYGECEEFRCKAKLIANTNGLPPTKSNDLFKSGRVFVVPFGRHFTEEEQDKDLKSKFRQPENLSGILNFCIEGLKKYYKDGLKPPASVLKATEEYQQENDKLKQFFDDCMIQDGSNTPVSEIYPVYKLWCIENGYKAEGKRSFMNKMREKKEFADMGKVKGKLFHNVLKSYSINKDTLEKYKL